MSGSHRLSRIAMWALPIPARQLSAGLDVGTETCPTMLATENNAIGIDDHYADFCKLGLREALRPLGGLWFSTLRDHCLISFDVIQSKCPVMGPGLSRKFPPGKHRLDFVGPAGWNEPLSILRRHRADVLQIADHRFAGNPELSCVRVALRMA